MSIARKSTRPTCALFSTSLFIGTALAQQPVAKTAAPANEEEMFDKKIREFGYWSGAAYGCVQDAKQVEVERKVLESFNQIARLFGTDGAFFYAAALGN